MDALRNFLLSLSALLIAYSVGYAAAAQAGEGLEIIPETPSED